MLQLNQLNWRKRRTAALLALTAGLIVSPAVAQVAPVAPAVLHQVGDPHEPGLHGNDTWKLINQRTITPAGEQMFLGDLPMNAILAPDGRHLLVSNIGAGIQSLQVVDTQTHKVQQTIPYYAPDGLFTGLAYSPDGSKAYASGGGSNVVHTFSVGSNGDLTSTGDIKSVGPTNATPLGNAPWPAGLSLSPDGKTLYVADNLSNTVAVIDTTSHALRTSVPVGSFPYTTLASKDGKRVYASNWGDGTVSVIDSATNAVVGTISVGQHPSAMTFSADDVLLVADSNSDAVSAVRTTTGKEFKRLSLAPYPNAPLSSSPEGLAVSPDGKSLYVADAGSDEVSVVSLDAEGEPGSVLGRIPTAWYPSAVVPSADGRTLYVTNGKGYGAGPNATGLYPDPTRRNPPIVDAMTGYNDGYCNCTFENYTGSMIAGVLSSISVPRAGLLGVYTSQVARNNNYPRSDGENDADAQAAPANSAVPSREEDSQKSPIKHVIYILKENRTFDQVFGDLSAGDRDPSLVLFGRNNTPNLHALAERFGILDNFYADAEVSADGHNWATSANASDYNEKMWPQDYSPGAGRNRGYDFEGGTTVNLSPGGYLWDAAAKANITYRDYGEFLNNGALSSAKLIPESQAATCGGPVAHSYSGVTIPAGQVLCFPPTTANPTTTPNLVGHFDPKFRGYDLRYREADRVAEWKREFDQFVANNDLPQLEIVRIPNDHTSGTAANRPSPQAYVAENDKAVGDIVDIVSHSKYWASTAIFITEDDAQNGPDHVDAHRTESLVISPYTSRAANGDSDSDAGSQPRVDHTLYDTAAMLRTMELILGLHPLSQYDANAVPIRMVFGEADDLPPSALQPYASMAETIPISQVNTALSFGAEVSAQMNFDVEDAAPMDELNAIIWHAVRGADTPYPDMGGAAQTSDVDGA